MKSFWVFCIIVVIAGTALGYIPFNPDDYDVASKEENEYCAKKYSPRLAYALRPKDSYPCLLLCHVNRGYIYINEKQVFDNIPCGNNGVCSGGECRENLE